MADPKRVQSLRELSRELGWPEPDIDLVSVVALESVARLREEREAWKRYAALTERDRARFEMALRKIRREEGKVCGEYEICKHGSCMSSYSSWAIADEALNAWETQPEQERTEQ